MARDTPVFISYARSDERYATELMRRLALEPDIAPWQDRISMSPGDFEDQLKAGIDSSRLSRPGHDACGAQVTVGREGMALRPRERPVHRPDQAGVRFPGRRRRALRSPRAAAGLDAEDSDLRFRSLLEAVRRRAAEPMSGDAIAVPRRQPPGDTSSTVPPNSIGSSRSFSTARARTLAAKPWCCTAPADSARRRSR